MLQSNSGADVTENTNPPLFGLQGVKEAFGTNLVVNNVDFELLPGEFHALVGENGVQSS